VKVKFGSENKSHLLGLVKYNQRYYSQNMATLRYGRHLRLVAEFYQAVTERTKGGNVLQRKDHQYGRKTGLTERLKIRSTQINIPESDFVLNVIVRHLCYVIQHFRDHLRPTQAENI
jgi:hypothetical protein